MNGCATLDDVLSAALAEELASTAACQRARGRLRDASARSLVDALLEEEAGHHERVRALRTDPACPADAPLSALPTSELGASFKPLEEAELEAHATPRDVLLLFLKQENRARWTFERLASSAREEPLRAFLARLAEEEAEQCRRFVRRFALVCPRLDDH